MDSQEKKAGKNSAQKEREAAGICNTPSDDLMINLCCSFPTLFQQSQLLCANVGPAWSCYMGWRPGKGRCVSTELQWHVTAFPQISTWRWTALLLSKRRALVTC